MNEIIDQDQRIREKSFLLMIPLFAVAGLLWTLVYYYYGAIRSAIIPGSYTVISFLSLLFFRSHRNFNIFRNVQLGFILLLPFLLHLSLGDFVSSSAIILWSILCPLGALAFQNTKAAGYWLSVFIILVIAAFFLENKLFPADTRLPVWLINIFFVLNITAVPFLSFFMLRYFVNQNELIKKELKQEQALLSIEREKSERLLLNILPPAIAKRLKDGENVIANEHPEAVILFADIVGFTKISQQVPPAILVENLNKIFTHFDTLVEKYGLEKIKTIGDSYMAVAGLDEAKQNYIQHTADLALNMIADIDKFSLDGEKKCMIRIGIHVGPVISGVIGSKKFSYDVWGDAVNTASRMESFSEPGKIQVTEKFYAYIKTEYDCEYRGQTEIKSKGLMNLYFLKGKKNTAWNRSQGS